MWRCIHSNEAFCCQSANSVDVECLSALAVSTTAIYIQFHFQYDWMSGDQLFLPLAIVLFASSTHTYDIRTLTIQQTTLFLSLSMYFLLSLSLSVIVSGRETDWQEKRDLEKKASRPLVTCLKIKMLHQSTGRAFTHLRPILFCFSTIHVRFHWQNQRPIFTFLPKLIFSLLFDWKTLVS